MRAFRPSNHAARVSAPRSLFAPAALAGLALATGLSSASPAQVSTAWSVPQGSPAVALDAFNNVFTASYSQNLGSEVEITKRDVNGNFLWTSSFDQTDNTKWENQPFLATDSQGNVIVSTTLMSGFSNPVNAASVVMKFSPTGTFLWRQVYENAFDGSYTRRCLVDEFDQIYVVGVGPGPFGFTSKVKKFAPDGSTLWTYNDSDGIGAAFHAKFAPNGDLLIIGRGTIGSINGYARITRNGQKVWSLAGVQSLTVGDAASDSAGNTYVVHGEFVVSNAGTVIKKLDPSGSLLWQQTYPGTGFRVVVGPDQQPVVCGFPNTGSGGAYFFKVDQSGNPVWTNPNADGPLALLLHAQMEVDASGDTYLAAGTLFEMAICKVNRDGSSAWTKTHPGSYAFAMALGKQLGSVFVVGGQTARFDDAAEGQWLNLHNGLPGLAQSQLDAEGPWQQGGQLHVRLSLAPAAAAGLHIFGASSLFLPLLGGTLVPAPDAFLSYTTDAVGQTGFVFQANNPVVSGTQFWMQSWTIDANAPQLVGASNALRCTAP
jgi:hypothetical protein